ncbi:MAG: outer membrane protein transport protein, partial [Chromatiales bacterium]
LANDRSIGLSLYGNGGMNTDYPSEIRPIVPFNLIPFCRGAFCDGRANINYEQLFINLTYAQEIGDGVSVGVSPIAAIQRFRAKGLTVFGLFSHDAWSSGLGILPNPLAVDGIDDNSYDWSFGGGLKVGVLADLSPTVSLGAAYQTKMYMTKFDEYDDLFAEDGDLDIPATANIGLAFKPNSEHTFTFDIQRIFYSDVAAIGNPGTSRLLSCGLVNFVRPFDDNNCLLGGSNGAGFGWDDMTVFKAGWQWEYDARTTARLGFSYGEQPIGSSEILFNILAPATIEKHITAGLTRKLGENNELSLAVTYAMETEVDGPNPFSLNFEDITLRMHQWDIDIGWSWIW